MKNRILLFLLLGCCSHLQLLAQIPSPSLTRIGTDVARKTPYASARIQSMGGATTGLGGELGLISKNPAALGFINEPSFSVSFGYQNTGSSALLYAPTLNSQLVAGQNLETNEGRFGIDHLAITFAPIKGDANSDMRRIVGSISYTRTQDFNQDINYANTNSLNSLAFVALDEANFAARQGFDPIGNGGSFVGALYDLGLISPFYSSAGISNFPLPAGTQQEYFTIVPDDENLVQNEQLLRSGSGGQFDFSMGINWLDKFYIGGGVGISNSSVIENQILTEQFSGTNIGPAGGIQSLQNTIVRDFDFQGVNFTTSFMGRFGEDLLVGIRLASPTYYSVSEFSREVYTATANLSYNDAAFKETVLFADPTFRANRGFADLSAAELADRYGEDVTIAINGSQTTGFDINYPTYSFRTPGSAAVGLTYLFGKVGLLTIDAEYVNYQQIRFSDPSSASTFNSENRYFTEGLSDQELVLRPFKSVVNLYGGGEVKLGSIALRAGGFYLPTPQELTNSSNQFVVSGDRTGVTAGVGYFKGKFRIDLSSMLAWQTDQAPLYILLSNTRSTDQPYRSVDLTSFNTTLTGTFKIN